MAETERLGSRKRISIFVQYWSMTRTRIPLSTGAIAAFMIVLLAGGVGYYYESTVGAGSTIPSSTNSSSSVGATIRNLTSTSGHTRSIAINPRTDILYYGYDGSNVVTAYNLTSNRIVASIQVSLANRTYFAQIMGIAVNPATDMVYVVDSGGVTIIDGRNNSVVAAIELGGFPNGVAVNPSTDKIYVTGTYTSEISVIDGRTNSLSSEINLTKGASGIIVDPETDVIYIVNNTNSIVNNQVVSRGRLWVVSGVNNTVLGSYQIGSYPEGLVVNPRSNTLYISDRIDVNGSGLGGSTGGLTIIDLRTYRTVSNVIFHPESGDTGAVAIDPVTDLVYVASCNYGVQILNETASMIPFLAPSRGCPSDLVVDPSTHIAYVTELLGNSIFSVYA